MKYVNANAEFYGKVTYLSPSQPSSYEEPFDRIAAVRDNDGNYYIEDFLIKTDINVLGTDNPKKISENPICCDATLLFTLRLTRCETRAEKERGVLPSGLDIASFAIDFKELRERGELSKACYDFYNYTNVTLIKSIRLPSVGNAIGKYVLKVLVRDSSQKKDTIQSMSPLLITEPIVKSEK